MPATDVTFGITRHEGALIDSVETTAKIEKKELKGSNGNIARVKTFNPTTSFSVKGHGTMSYIPGIGDPEIDGIDPETGVAVIEEVKQTDTNDDFDGWDYSGTHYPNAQEVE